MFLGFRVYRALGLWGICFWVLGFRALGLWGICFWVLGFRALGYRTFTSYYGLNSTEHGLKCLRSGTCYTV